LTTTLTAVRHRDTIERLPVLITLGQMPRCLTDVPLDAAQTSRLTRLGHRLGESERKPTRQQQPAIADLAPHRNRLTPSVNTEVPTGISSLGAPPATKTKSRSPPTRASDLPTVFSSALPRPPRSSSTFVSSVYFVDRSSLFHLCFAKRQIESKRALLLLLLLSLLLLLRQLLRILLTSRHWQKWHRPLLVRLDLALARLHPPPLSAGGSPCRESRAPAPRPTTRVASAPPPLAADGSAGDTPSTRAFFFGLGVMSTDTSESSRATAFLPGLGVRSIDTSESTRASTFFCGVAVITTGEWFGGVATCFLLGVAFDGVDCCCCCCCSCC
jgi:hypothetical protein